MADGPASRDANGLSLENCPVLYYQPVCKAHDKELQRENFGIRRVACSDSSVLTGSWRPSIKVWKLAESKLEESGKLQRGASGVMNLELADDQNVVAVSHDDGCVVIWDLRTPHSPIGQLHGADSSVAMQVKFVPNNPQQLVSGGDSGNICFWDLRTYRRKVTRDRAGMGASSSSKTDKSKYEIASKHEDKRFAKRLKRDPDAVGADATTNGDHGGLLQSPISSLALSGDGKLLGCGRVNGEVGIMWLDSLEWCGHVQAHFSQSSARVRGLTFDRTSHYLLSGGDDNHLSALNAELWTRRTKSNAPKPLPALERIAGHRGWITSCSTCPHERQRFLLTTSMDRTVRLWDYANSRLMKLPAEVKRGAAEDRERAHVGEVMDAAWAPSDGRFYVTVGSDALLALYTLTAEAREKMALPHVN